MPLTSKSLTTKINIQAKKRASGPSSLSNKKKVAKVSGATVLIVATGGAAAPLVAGFAGAKRIGVNTSAAKKTASQNSAKRSARRKTAAKVAGAAVLIAATGGGAPVRRRDADRAKKKDSTACSGTKPKSKGGAGGTTGKKRTGGGRFKDKRDAAFSRARKAHGRNRNQNRKNSAKGSGGKQIRSTGKKAGRSSPKRSGKNRVNVSSKTATTALLLASGVGAPIAINRAMQARAASGATKRKVRRRDVQSSMQVRRCSDTQVLLGTKKITERAKLAYKKHHRMRSNTRRIGITKSTNIPMGITAGRFLPPVPSVSILTTEKKPIETTPPPDVPASSTSDEMVLQAQESLPSLLRELSIGTYRPEVLGLLDFMPLFDNNREPTTVHDLYQLRDTVRELKMENVEDTVLALKTEDIEDSFTALRENYESNSRQVEKLIETLSSLLQAVGVAKLSLDLKDNAEVLSAAAHQALTSDDTISYDLDQADLNLKSVMINDLDFTGEGYATFSNTKVFGQILIDLARSIQRHSYSLMSKDNPARNDDESSVNYNYDYLASHHKFRFRLGTMGAGFDASNYDKFLEFAGSLPTDSTDRLRLLIASVSRELTVSAGIGYFAEKTLGERFKVTENPIYYAIGTPGANVLSQTKPDGSLADYLMIEDSAGNSILPFETRSFRDRKNRTFLPGSVVFIDSALRGEDEKLFNVDSFSLFAKEFNKVTDDVEELIGGLLNLDDENRTLHPSSIYKTVLQRLLDSIQGVKNRRAINKEQAAVISLLKVCNSNSALKHMVYKFVLQLRDIMVEVTKQEEETLATQSTLAVELQNIQATRATYQDQLLAFEAMGASQPSSPYYSAWMNASIQLQGLDAQTSQLTARMNAPDISISGTPATTTSLGPPASFSTISTSASRYSSTTVRGLSSNISKSASPIQLTLKAAPNPLTVLAQSIVTAFSENVGKVSEDALRGYLVYRYDAASLYSALKSMGSTSRRSDNLLTAMVETAMELQKAAQVLARRDGGEENYAVGGTTNWHGWTGNSLLLTVFEIYCGLAASYSSSSIVSLSRDRMVLAIKTSVNEGVDEAIREILDLAKEEDSAARKELASKVSLEISSQSDQANEALAATGKLSFGGALKSYDEDENPNAAFIDLSNNFDALVEDFEYIKKMLSIVQGIGVNVEIAATQLKSFFDMSDTSSENKATLAALTTSKIGRQILSTISSRQLAVCRYLQAQLSAPDSSLSYLPVKMLVDEEVSSAFDVIYGDPALAGTQANNIRTLAIGIPTGMIDALMNPPYVMGSKESSETSSQKNLIKVNIHKRDLEFGDIVFKPRSLVFDSSLFIMPGAFSEANPKKDTFADLAAAKVRYTQVSEAGIVNSSTGKEMLEGEKYGSLDPNSVAAMLSNHLVDYAMKQYYKVVFGIDLDEACFTSDENDNDLLIDQDGLSALMLGETNDAISPWLTTGDVPISNLAQVVTSEGTPVKIADINDAKAFLVPSVSDVISSGEDTEEELEVPEMNAEQLENFRMLCASNIFRPSRMKRQIMSPKLFDRVFLLPVDPDDFDIDVDATTETELGKEKYTSKTLKTITTAFVDHLGNETIRMAPKNMGENFSAFNEFFVTIETVSTGE